MRLQSAATTPRPTRRERRLARTARLAAGVLCLLVTALAADGGGAWAASAFFVAERTSVTWDGSQMDVTFQEVGVDASETTIAIEVTADVVVTCTDGDGAAMLSSRASATVQDVTDYPTGDDATVTGHRRFAVSVSEPTIVGLPCSGVETERTVAVVLTDLRTGAYLTVTSEVVPGPAAG